MSQTDVINSAIFIAVWNWRIKIKGVDCWLHTPSHSWSRGALFLAYHFPFLSLLLTLASHMTIGPFEGSAEPPKSCRMRQADGPWPGWCVEECEVTKERPRCAYNTFTCIRPTLFRSLWFIWGAFTHLEPWRAIFLFFLFSSFFCTFFTPLKRENFFIDKLLNKLNEKLMKLKVK